MTIRIFNLGPLQTNCYVLAGDTNAIVIDPGGDPAEVVEYLTANALTVTHILNTHLHFDHTAGNKTLSGVTGAPILCCDKDEELLDSWLGKGGDMGIPPIDLYEWQNIAPGETQLAGFDCTVLHTPGHSRGSLTFYFPKVETAFVGDLIFYRSIGRTDFPGGDLDELKHSVTERIFTLPPTTKLLSGHGPETTVADEMTHNPFFSEF
ncbi:MBL fold metallo-hydrolase [Pseudodesulfovibrio sp. JC047]|uniref:MBL fold metallo-hydrolase n=1 Tax=Pseudodesulfovibrio sp. JC047 TaxID=2683199 RepID=UPI0013D59BAE|nr:MBL fold metallo-hydrolase [Pseudodesulfovibrio sp. JC047]NDV18432.1 MBL fold metallo-hydrolase [Pseudodesulfovibrio sp. JC047]